ncbi:CC142 protein, partial [Chauna torquata]|nr:CC142 protein [Chauna torquata]
VPQRCPSAARVPLECQEQLGRLCLRLLCQGVLRAWERDFAQALGSGLCDRCSAVPEPSGGAAQSSTARLLQQLYPGLAFALRCLP